MKERARARLLRPARCDEVRRRLGGARRRGAPPRRGLWRAALALLCLVTLWVGGASSRLGQPGQARAGNPDLRWRTIETEHFFVHYHAGDADFADRVALVAERAYARLTVAYGHAPFLKVHVVITDETDEANGLANAVPYPRIRLHVTAPESMSVLSAYDDWIDILVTHELTHVVHLDTVHRLPMLINGLLGFGVVGKVSSPNILQPRWLIEGLATFEESRQLAHGRERSALFEMYLRVAVVEGRFQSMDRMNSGARVYPHGTSVYLYGLHLVAFMADRYGTDKLRELSHVYAGRLIPFGINRALEDTIGVGFDEVWEEFREWARLEYFAKAREIRARGVRQGRRLTFGSSSGASGRHARHPAFSPDGQVLIWYDDDGHHRPGVRRMAVRGGPIREGRGIGNQGAQSGVERIIDVMGGSRASWVAGDDALVFEMLGYHDLRYLWSDLYLWRGGDRNQREQLTFGMRARHPDVSPDGRTVAFVRNDSAQSRLAFLDLDDRAVTEVAAIDRMQQIDDPRWSPDGTQVAVSLWQHGGMRDIWIYTRATGEWERITHDRNIDTAPAWSPDGRWLLFSSDRGGVFNVYAFDTQNRALRQVTNVIGGAFEPVLSPDGTLLCYVGYTSSGFDLWAMEWDEARWSTPLPPQSALPLAQDAAPVASVAGADAALDPRPPSASSRRYLAMRTFFPRTVFPSALEVGSSTFLTDVGLTFGVSDVLALHRLSGTFRWLTDYRTPTGSVFYVWDRRLPTFYAGFGRSLLARSGYPRYVLDDDGALAPGGLLRTGYLERATRLTVGVDVPVIRHLQHVAIAGIGYEWTRYDVVDRVPGIDPNLPSATPPETGDVAGLNLRFEYTSAQRFRHSMYSERGRRVQLDSNFYHRVFGSDFGDVRIQGAYTEFVPMPWRGHQTIALRLGGGASTGELRRRGSFFVGGLSRDEDILRRLLTRSAINEVGVVRGIAPGALVGSYYVVFNGEYRIPLADVERGMGALPFFLERVGLNLFGDTGLAWRGRADRKDVVGGLGAALVFALKLGYGERVDLMLQYAHGFARDVGADWFQFAVARPF